MRSRLTQNTPTDNQGTWKLESLEDKALAWPLEGSAGDTLDIGRDPRCTIHLGHIQVSSLHARLTRATDMAWILEDLHSRNGTSVNGKILTPGTVCHLRHGDEVFLGGCGLRCISPAAVPVSIPVQAHPEPVLPTPTARPTAPAPLSSTRELHLDQRDLREIILGRDPNAGMLLDHPEISWNHAILKWIQGEEWMLQDSGSTNGTWVNGKRLAPGPLGEVKVGIGDRIVIGPFRFALAGGGHLEAEDQAGRLHLEARGIYRIAPGPNGPMTLLNNVSLQVAPCEMVAIIGPSGAGKSTLLLALNGYVPAQSGRVLLNGADYYSSRDAFRAQIGYVPQDDIVHPDLTVEKALYYAAMLRLPTDTLDSEIEMHTARVLDELGLAHRRKNLVRTLSGGERKRVNIAVELLTRPSLLFLDEPTTGLDAGLERRVTELLLGLARQGRTVIVVTHAAATLTTYDNVIMMARGGRLAFHGRPEDALKHFQKPDFAGVYESLEEAASASMVRESEPAPNVTSSSLPPLSVSAPPRAGWRQWITLLSRYLDIIRADQRNLIFWIAQAPFVALLVAILFGSNVFTADVAKRVEGLPPIADGPNLLFLLSLASAFFGLCNSCREIVKERPLLLRERHAGLGLWPYILSKVAVLGALSLIQCILLLALVSLKIPLGLHPDQFFVAFLILWAGAMAAILTGLAVSAVATSPDQAITMVAALLIAQVVFSGIFSWEQMGNSVSWISALCPVRWTYGGLCSLFDIAGKFRDLPTGSVVPPILDVMETPIKSAAIGLTALNVGLLGITAYLVRRCESRH